MAGLIGIKVDVDTFEGMRRGVPVLLDLFRRRGTRASFFIPMGKDHTGRTVKRVFRRGFLKKAGRVGVIETYGLKTLMYGLLLPGPEVARQNGDLLLCIRDEGHEVGIHGLDHVFWHDSIRSLAEDRTIRELDHATEVYRDILGAEPESFAAPGWTINSYALKYFEDRHYLYTSNTRGSSPFFPRLGGRAFRVLEIPSTLPTLDEVVGLKGAEARRLAAFFVGCLGEGPNIITVHTEMEGKRWAPFLDRFIEESLGAGCRFLSLGEIARDLLAGPPPPVCDVLYGTVEGRAGEVCCQAPA